ncbi:putative quinol monooxygenase [Marinitenerispora sediminis]|uniref:Antibiotic biosynthesis monooxygenase n=1 Tax=Marinitenerispora sediminis TaxID=1931232 RepID=A0A368TEN7_9ACTN|nr:antibiotic biosynthesis monooxygenase [Marinitenerispora sediminis]RCV50417.1 antibiotic biosynthesis monooxygenase [Marinitenerispora sediminis]RCV55305.1 antibiotic biosynthesis monooxygenase [Marinitenerispora sediminis]RCV62487.1 antibiotic biosynthesis monooxygenase [Marinitenerispora sediminis]
MSQNPVVVTAVFQFRPDARDRVRDALRAAAARVHEEPGCELYALHEAEDRLVLVEKWASRRALDTHSAATAVRDLHARVDDLLLAPAEVTVLSPVPSGRPDRGAL